MRLLICAGGTGGGVYPALTVLQALGNEADPILWVGGEKGMEAELVQRQNIPFAGIPAAGVHGVGLRSLPGNLIQLLRGTLAARRILREFKPEAILFTGGYVAVPLALMAIPRNSVLYVPDIEPGLALKTLARFSDIIALTAEESRAFFSPKKRMELTGYPTRPEFGQWTRETGRKTLGLRQDIPVLLVAGGSKGARSINRALATNLPKLLKTLQIVHISGQLDYEEMQAIRSGLSDDLAQNYSLHAYLHEEMGAALASADLAISRAGASTLGEYPLFGLPAILVPYPYAWRYQKVNAEHLVRAGAAQMIKDEELAGQLLPAVQDLFTNQTKLEAMATAMRSLAHKDAAVKIADLLRELADPALQKGRLTTW